MDINDPQDPSGAQEDVIELDFRDEDVLYKAYMPFIKEGGIFIKTKQDKYRLGDELNLKLLLLKEPDPYFITGKIVWISPQDPHSEFPGGIGVQLEGEDIKKIRKTIEAVISGKMADNERTDTL